MSSERETTPFRRPSPKWCASSYMRREGAYLAIYLQSRSSARECVTNAGERQLCWVGFLHRFSAVSAADATAVVVGAIAWHNQPINHRPQDRASRSWVERSLSSSLVRTASSLRWPCLKPWSMITLHSQSGANETCCSVVSSLHLNTPLG